MWSPLRLSAFTGTLILAMTSMSVAKEPPSPLSLILQTQNASVKTSALSEVASSATDELHLDLKRDKARYEKIQASLTNTYGPPKTTRGNKLIWEIENMTEKFGQSTQATIVAGEENGAYFVYFDCRTPAVGNNPRLTRFKSFENNVRPRQAIQNFSKPNPYEQD